MARSKAADLGTCAAEAATLCDEVSSPHCPLKLIFAFIFILPLEALHLPCCLHPHCISI